MSNIFQNVTLSVEKAPTVKFSKERLMSDIALANLKLRELQEQQSIDELNEEFEQLEIVAESKNLAASIAERQLNESRFDKKISTISETAKSLILKDIVFELYYKSLILDEDFLLEHAHDVRKIVDDYIDTNGGYSLLEKSISTSKSLYLNKVKNVIDTVTLEVCKRKLTDTSEDIKLIDFDLSDKEKSDLDYAKQDLSIDQISELVKDKVLTVIKDEKKQQELEADIVETIEGELKDDPEVVDDKSISEALHNIFAGKSLVEETTLFNALLRNTMSEYILENVATAQAANMAANNDGVPEIYEDDLFDDDSGDDDDYLDNEVNKDIILAENTSVDMDLVFSEAITKYTLMELLHTIKLESFSYDNIRKLTHKLVTPLSTPTEATVPTTSTLNDPVFGKMTPTELSGKTFIKGNCELTLWDKKYSLQIRVHAAGDQISPKYQKMFTDIIKNSNKLSNKAIDLINDHVVKHYDGTDLNSRDLVIDKNNVKQMVTPVSLHFIDNEAFINCHVEFDDNDDMIIKLYPSLKIDFLPEKLS